MEMCRIQSETSMRNKHNSMTFIKSDKD